VLSYPEGFFMTYATTHDPVAYAHLADVLPRLFKGFFEEPSAAPSARTPVAGFAVDVREDAAAYTLIGNLPGFSKDDIKIEIDGNQVNIRAQSPTVSDEAQAGASGQSSAAPAQAKVLRNERYAGAFARGFSLPVEIDDAQSQAKYENGVLTLTLPKKPQALAKRISIA
jgi:HSP20 family protein